MEALQIIQSSIKKYNNCIVGFLKKYKKIFCLFFFGGILIHLPVFIYELGNGDTIKWSIYQPNFIWERAQGRWMLEWISFVRNDKVIPIFISILCILYLSASAIIIIDALNLKNQFLNALFGFLFMVSPFVMYYLIIYYTADAYCLGILLSTITGWLLIKGNRIWHHVIAVILATLSLAIYQSNMNVFIVLFLIGIFADAIRHSENVKNQIKHTIHGFFDLLIALALYLISVKLSFSIFGGSWADYKGMNTIGLYSFESIRGIFKTYFKELLLLYFKKNEYVSGSLYYSNIINGTAIYVIVAALVVILFAVSFIRRLKTNNKSAFWILIIACILLLFWSPITFASPAFGASDASTTLVNAMINPQYSFVFLILGVLVESTEIKLKYLANCLTSVVIIGMIFNLSLVSNEGYYGNQLAWYQHYALAARVLDRMEQCDGWYSDMPIAIYGGFTGNISANYPVVVNEIQKTNMPLMWAGQTQTGWIKFFKEYFGVEYQDCGNDFYYSFSNSNEYTAMPSFPNKGSVRVYDGVLVVKISTD